MFIAKILLLYYVEEAVPHENVQFILLSMESTRVMYAGF